MADTNIKIDDRIDADITNERVTVTLDATPISVKKGLRGQIKVSQKFKVVPDHYSAALRYTMPDSALNYVSQQDLTDSILESAAGSRVYVDEAMQYTEEAAEGTIMQKLTEIDVNYLSTGEADQYALIAELDQQTIAQDFYIDKWTNDYIQDRDPWTGNDEYLALRWAAIDAATAEANYPLGNLTGTPLFDEGEPIIRAYTTITAQHIYDQSVRVGNSMASYYEDVRTLADDQSAQATKTEKLSATVGTAVGELITKEAATVGLPQDDLGGMMIGGSGSGTSETPPAQNTRIGGEPLVTGDKYVYKASEPLTELNRVETQSYILSGIQPVYSWMGPFMRWRLVSDTSVPNVSATKYSTNTSTGKITGWSFSDGDGGSNFMIAADNFKLVAAGQDVANAYCPFEVNAATGEIRFIGTVTFGSIEDPPDMVAENTNINTISNIVPTLMWYTSNHADYTFVGTVTVADEAGADEFSEPTVTLEAGDEVYSPYVEELVLYNYQVSFAFKGDPNAVMVKADDTTFTTYPIVSAETKAILDPAKWYILQLLFNKEGTTGTTFGKIVEATTLNEIASIPDMASEVGNTRFFLGFVGPATGEAKLSRVSIEVLSEESTPIDSVTASDFSETGFTTIHGGRIATDSITAAAIATGTITTNELNVMNVSYFTNDSGYTDDTAADAAQSTADSKNTIFNQTATPTADNVNDIWIHPTTGTQKTWTGSAWLLTDVANAINSNTTTILGAKITTGSIEAAKLDVSDLSAISANLGTITAGTINADIVNAGVLNLARIPATTNIVRFSDSSTYTVPGEDTWYTFASVTVDVAVGETVDIECAFTHSKGNNTAASSLRLRRGSTLIYGTDVIGGMQDSLFAIPIYTANAWQPNNITTIDTPGAGTFTYYAQFGTHARLSEPYQAVRQRHMKATIYYK